MPQVIYLDKNKTKALLFDFDLEKNHFVDEFSDSILEDKKIEIVQLEGKPERTLFAIYYQNLGHPISNKRMAELYSEKSGNPIAVKSVQTYAGKVRSCLGDQVLQLKGSIKLDESVYTLVLPTVVEDNVRCHDSSIGVLSAPDSLHTNQDQEEVQSFIRYLKESYTQLDELPIRNMMGDEEGRVKGGLRQLFQWPQLRLMDSSQDYPNVISSDENLLSILPSNELITITGDYGSGKTTLARYIFLMLAERLEDESGLVPFYVDLGVTSRNLRTDFGNAIIYHCVDSLVTPFTRGYPELEALIFQLDSRAILILDGLDECRAMQKTVLTQIEDLLRVKGFNGTILLLGRSSKMMFRVHSVQYQLFSLDSIEGRLPFIEKYVDALLGDLSSSDKLTAINLLVNRSSDEYLSSICTTPLALFALVSFYARPSNDIFRAVGRPVDLYTELIRGLEQKFFNENQDAMRLLHERNKLADALTWMAFHKRIRSSDEDTEAPPFEAQAYIIANALYRSVQTVDSYSHKERFADLGEEQSRWIDLAESLVVGSGLMSLRSFPQETTDVYDFQSAAIEECLAARGLALSLLRAYDLPTIDKRQFELWPKTSSDPLEDLYHSLPDCWGIDDECNIPELTSFRHIVVMSIGLMGKSELGFQDSEFLYRFLLLQYLTKRLMEDNRTTFLLSILEDVLGGRFAECPKGIKHFVSHCIDIATHRLNGV